MSKIKKIKISIVSIALLMCMLATSVFAGVNSKSITDNVMTSVVIGSVYINVKTSSIYAETVATYPSSSSSDYVSISATNCSGKTNVGSNYTTAWTDGPGDFWGCADGSIRRGIYSGSAYTSSEI